MRELATGSVSCRVLHAGLLTTVQDLGRFGHQRFGIPVSGAMDPVALRLANLLVGNGENAAAIEITLLGPRLAFDTSCLIALSGGDLQPMVDGERVPVGRALLVHAGATMSFGEAERGCRTYLAIAGGVCTPEVLGSRSTYVRGGFGGVGGRALRKDDVLAVGSTSALSRRISGDLEERSDARRVHVATWGASSVLVPRYSSSPSVRLLVGEHMHMLTPESRELLFRTEFRVGAQSDRMGFRLEGPALEVSEPTELLSEGVTFGTVQLPPGGKPIILMADRQTTGGYPRVGEVASVDLPLVAQLRPGHRIRFRPISLAEAHALYLAREADFAQARTAIALRYKLTAACLPST